MFMKTNIIQELLWKSNLLTRNNWGHGSKSALALACYSKRQSPWVFHFVCCWLYPAHPLEEKQHFLNFPDESFCDKETEIQKNLKSSSTSDPKLQAGSSMTPLRTCRVPLKMGFILLTFTGTSLTLIFHPLHMYILYRCHWKYKEQKKRKTGSLRSEILS